MINLAPDAHKLLYAHMQRNALAGLRLTGKGDRCQGVQVEAGWVQTPVADDAVQACDGLDIYIAESLTSIVSGIQITLGTSSKGPSLLFTPQYAACECSSSSCGDATVNEQKGA
jgi:Fe-S cluster assembly iron-binding protein IscA